MTEQPPVKLSEAGSGANPGDGEPVPAVKVTIAYCAECGYEPQALSLAEYLMREFKNDLSSIELIPWYEGSFDVSVGAELVHSMYRDGGFPENQTIGEKVRAQLQPA